MWPIPSPCLYIQSYLHVYNLVDIPRINCCSQNTQFYLSGTVSNGDWDASGGHVLKVRGALSINKDRKYK